MASSDTERPIGRQLDRRSFLQSSGGLAAGIAVTMVPTAAVLAAPAGAAQRGVAPQAIDPPSTSPPGEPVMAYVHDAQRGEVTIMAGTSEMTYRDPELVKRLLDAATVKQS